MVIDRDGTFRLLLISSVSRSPPYLINLLIHQLRTNSIMCSVDSVPKLIQNRHKEKKVRKKTTLFNTVFFYVSKSFHQR
jgi:hypothetical protein